MKLYELTQNYINLQELLDDPTVPVEIINAALEEVGENIEEKAENIAKLIKTNEVEAAGLKEEESRIAARRKSLEGRNKSLKIYLEGAMIAVNKPKIKGKLFSFNIQKNPASVDILDETMIPSDYLVTKVEISRKDILQAIKDGQEVPGAVLKQSESLRIR